MSSTRLYNPAWRLILTIHQPTQQRSDAVI
jgi:hypothetical protein